MEAGGQPPALTCPRGVTSLWVVAQPACLTCWGAVRGAAPRFGQTGTGAAASFRGGTPASSTRFLSSARGDGSDESGPTSREGRVRELALESLHLLSRTFFLHSCDQITDAGLATIAAGCPDLETLYLDSCEQITDAGLATIGAGCPDLKSLHLDSCEQITDAGLATIAAGCPYLEYLSLTNCNWITDAGLATIGEGCRVSRRTGETYKNNRRTTASGTPSAMTIARSPGGPHYHDRGSSRASSSSTSR